MFAAFIYTECISAGPFKSESGFKFKSVQEAEIYDEATPSAQLEQRMNTASAAFLPYKAPTIDSFMKPEEFLALDKQWSVQEIGPGNFMFTRLFTSGVSNGRPDNPFHQGFVYDFADIDLIVASTGEMSGLTYARPADFRSWTDWQNPRGDADLEAAELEPHNPPMPAIDSTTWARNAERTFEFDADESMQVLSGFEIAMRAGVNFGIDSGTVEEYLEWVSLLTHLIPLKTGWTTQFTTIESAKHFARIPAKTAIYRSESYVPRVDVTEWANLTKLVIEAGVFAEIDALIGQLSTALVFDPNSGSQALAALPLACCLIDQEQMDPTDLAVMVGLVAQLLQQLEAPTHWQSAAASEGIFSQLEKQGAALRLIPNGNQIYARLSGLQVLG